MCIRDSFYSQLPERFPRDIPPGPKGETPRGLVRQHRETSHRLDPPPPKLPDQVRSPCPVDYIGEAGRFLHIFYRKIFPLPMEAEGGAPVSYTHLRAHETRHDLVC